jgi:Leucine-rich repeat (LRR) protein
VLITFTEENDTTKSYTALTDSLGNYSLGLITDIEDNPSTIPTKFKLAQNYPNPFTSETAITYKLNEQSDVEVTIYDILGREIKKYSVGKQEAGIHGIKWDGRNNTGEKVTAGVYFYRLEAGKESLVNKMVLTRGSMGGTISLNSNFSTTTLSKETTTEVAAASYKVKIENTEETEPRIASMETENIQIEQDTTINFSVNKLPIANAGEDSEVKVGQYVMLDGTQSEVGDGSELHYSWYADTTNPAEISILRIWAETPAGFTEEGTYKFSLVVNDGIAYSEADEVVVEVGSREESKFEDPSLELEVRYTLKEPTEELTEEKLDSLEILVSEGIFGEVSSLYGLENCNNLVEFLFSSHNITDLTPLSGLTKLENLALDQTHILSDISPLANLVNLTELNLSSNNISDISALKNLTKLTSLRLSYNPINDIAALEDMKELNELRMISSLHDGLLNNTFALSGCSKLKRLYISKFNIDDISFVSALTELSSMSLPFCNIADISPISNCSQFTHLYLDNNSITDITSLEGLTNLVMLDLKYNQITNIEPLVNNSGLGQGNIVSLTGNPLDEISINQYIPELQNRGVTVSY